MEQITISYGRAKAQEGIDRVTANAERAKRGWLSLAYAFLELYVRRLAPLEEFTAEMVVERSVEAGMIQAHDDRAWAGPFRRAAKAGLIEKHPDKMGVCRKRHASVCVLWRKP